MVPDILDRRLIVLFKEGLSKLLKGCVKIFDSFNLQEVIKKAISMEQAALVYKFSSKGGSSRKDKPFFKKTNRNEIKAENRHK